MTTEMLRRQDELTEGGEAAFAFGDVTAFAFERPAAFASKTFDGLTVIAKAPVDPPAELPVYVLDRALFELVALQQKLKGEIRADGPEALAHSAHINMVERIIGLLTTEPVEALVDQAHGVAIEAAARICEGRSQSLMEESPLSVIAANEANKCAIAIRRVASRSAFATRPDLSRVATTVGVFDAAELVAALTDGAAALETEASGWMRNEDPAAQAAATENDAHAFILREVAKGFAVSLPQDGANG